VLVYSARGSKLAELKTAVTPADTNIRFAEFAPPEQLTALLEIKNRSRLTRSTGDRGSPLSAFRQFTLSTTPPLVDSARGNSLNGPESANHPPAKMRENSFIGHFNEKTGNDDRRS